LLDNDEGPNTGGMGAYAPAPVLTASLMKRIETEIFTPFLKGSRPKGFDFRGIIYFGIMMTPAGPQVLELTCASEIRKLKWVLPLLETDSGGCSVGVATRNWIRSMCDGKEILDVCGVWPRGYPGAYDKGK